MAIIRRKLSLTAVAGNASGSVTLGAANGILYRIQMFTTANGHDVDITVKDASTRNVFVATTWDYDNATLTLDGTVYTSLAIDSGMIGSLISKDTDGTASTAYSTGISVRGPLSVTLANAGTASVILVFHVEV